MNAMQDFKDLDDFDDELARRVPKQQKQKFPCMRCGGSGQYRGPRVNQPKSKCFACNGRGYFATSPEYRQKQKAQRQRNKQDQQAQNEATFAESQPELYRFLNDVRDWNDFARSLLDSVRKYGRLTEKQQAAAERMKTKVEHKQAESRERASKPAATLDLGVVHERFSTARANGIKRPKLRVGDLVISLAPDTGRNAGYLYVKRDDVYLGKVDPEGEFFRGRDCRDEDVEELKGIAEDVLAAAVAHGKRTGTCSCCGRTLTNAESIELGIGPICRANWGL